MTCIVGLRDERTGDLYLGGDSAACAGWDLTTLRDPKVFQVDGAGGPMLLGVSGYPRMAQLLRYRFEVPEHPAGLSVGAFVATCVVDAMRTLFKDAGYAQREKEQEQTDSIVLLGYRGRLLHLSTNYQANERSQPYEAIGCGASFALGVLYATATSRSPYTAEQRVHLALQAAETLSAGVRAPFTVLQLPGGGEPSVPSRPRPRAAKRPRAD